MAAYYNENDPYAAQWLRNLITAGHIPPGDVDERSIVDVRPDDLRGYTQCHFFAGIGGWPYALRLAGWPDDKEVWTGSCPCQPLSCAGQRKGHIDERHLWPAFFSLISERSPATVFGEQVSGKDGLEWLAAVRTDLEGIGYAIGAADLPACSVGAPHIRRRLFWVAHAQPQFDRTRSARARWRTDFTDGGAVGVMADHGGAGLEERQEQSARNERAAVERSGDAGELADSDGGDTSTEWLQCGGQYGQQPQDGRAARSLEYAAGEQAGLSRRAREPESAAGELGDAERARPPSEPQGGIPREFPHGLGQRGETGGHWSDIEWLPCIDGKWRPTKPGLFPLAPRLPKGMVRGSDPNAPFNADNCTEARVGRLRGYGNAIVPQVAAEFIAAARECLQAR